MASAAAGVAAAATAAGRLHNACVHVTLLLMNLVSTCSAVLQIFEALGTPNENMWAGVERLAHYRSNFPKWQPKDWAVLVPRLAGDPVGINLLASMLTYDPEARITAQEALKHPWFHDLAGSPAPAGISNGGGRAVTTSAGAAGPSAGPLQRLMHMPPQQGMAAARPPPMPSMLGMPGRAGVGLVQQPLGQLPVQHSLQQQQVLAQSLVHIQHPHVQLQQPQAQLQQLHLQQPQQHPGVHFQQQQQQQLPMAPAAAGAAAGLQAVCRNSQPSTACLWVSQRPAQHPAPGGPAGAAPTPA